MERRRDSSILLLTLVFLIGLLLLLGGACEPDLPLQIENRTDMVLTIYLKDNEMGNVEPNSTAQIKGITGTLSEWQIIAKNSQGEVIFSRKFAASELYELDYKVVISPPLEK